MTLDTRPPAPVRRTGASRNAPRDTERDSGRPSRSLVVALVLACAALMAVDKAGGDGSPLDPVRRVAGEVLGPAQAGVASAVRPITSIPDSFRSNATLRDENAALVAENQDLRNQLDKAGYNAHQVKALKDLQAVAGDIGYALVPARVISMSSAQSARSSVVLDAGSDAGLHPDMTVVAGAGLVGRITSVTAHTATVLLVIDDSSSVGGRIGDNMELGFVRGHGTLGVDDRLELELTDRKVVPKSGQAVFTWGSEGGAPYVAGVPIGTVGKVYESLRETSYRAEITPAVDFTALDLVGVVVPSGTAGRVIEADESLRGER
ncbi:rod shape-determining protein MreC [Nocardioides sp. WV_118_6]